MARAMASAEQVTEKWARGVANGVQDYRAGVQAVSQSPTAAAADAQQLYLQNVQEAVSSGKYERNLRAVSLEDWKRQTIEVGAARLSQGATNSKAKYQRKIAPVLQHIKAGRDALPPRGTYDQNVARMVQMVDHMKNYQS